MALRWYVARTRPLTEYSARKVIERAGIEVFLPCIHTLRPRPGRGNAPLFPGYIFLRYDLEELGWQPLGRYPQLLALVAFDGAVPYLPDEVIAELAQRVEAFNERGELLTRFHPGDWVHVSIGSVDSLAQVVAEAGSSRQRVKVLMEFMGRMISAQVPWQSLRSAQDYGPSAYGMHRGPRRTRGRGRWVRGFGPRVPASV